MRLKSHQQQQQQSTNQRLKTHVTIIIIISVVAEFCLMATTVAAAISLPHPATIQIGDPKQRILRQVAEDDKARDDCDCDTLYHKPHFTKGRSVIVELFEWKFVDVAEECRTFLGPKGYAGVQLSPVLEHTIIKTDKLKHPWWQRYETVSYRFASRSGDESDFWSMSRICNNNGVRIYLDVIFNHMAAPLHILLNATTENVDFNVNTLLETNVNIFNLSYPNVPYTSQHFHRPCAVGNSQSTHEIRNCQLNGHPDLDLGLPSVQKHIVGMLNKFIDMGVAGFHVYGAKYVWPNDLKVIHEQLKDLNMDFHFAKNSRPFMYHDICDIGLDSISKTEYATYGGVTEYLYAAELSTILRGKAPLSSLINWGPAMGFLSHQDAVIFVDSPETQRGLPHELGKNHVITHRNPQKYTMANALMMVHPYGAFKRIMSSYYYKEKNINQGPPTEKGDEDSIRSPELNDQQQCTIASGWVCEHRWPMMVNLVALANYFSVPEQKEESVIHFQTNGPNHIAFCRGHKAFVAMNNDAEKDFIMDVFTCLEPGVYCDVISGGLKEGAKECHGHRLEVDERGNAKLNLLVADDYDMQMELEGDEDRNVVENLGVLVVYVGSKIGSKIDEVWEVPADLGELELSVNLTVVEIPGDEEVNNSTKEDEDSDAGAKADGQISQTDDNESEGGGANPSHDASVGNPEKEEVPADVEVNNGANSKDEEIVEEQGQANKGENNEVAAAGVEEGEGGQEPEDGLAKNKKGNEGNSENEETIDTPDPDDEKSDIIDVPEGEATATGEAINESAAESQDQATDEKQEIAEDVRDPTKEEENSAGQDSMPDENQESTIDNEESVNEEEQGGGENPDANPNDGDGNDNHAGADAKTDGAGKLVESIDEKKIEETTEISDSDQDSNTPDEALDPDQVSDIPDEGADMAAPIKDDEESKVAEVADLEEEVVSLEENAKQIEEASEVRDPNPDSDITDEDENTAAPINDDEESKVAEVADLEEEVVSPEENAKQIDEASEVRDPNPDSDIPDEDENTAAPINDDEESKVAEVADLEEEVVSPEENAKQIDEASEVQDPNPDSDIPDEDENMAAPINDEEESKVADVADLEEEAASSKENENEIDEALEVQNPDQEEAANLAAPINDEEESKVADIVDLDIEPEATNASQEKDENAESVNEEVPVPVPDTENGITFSALNEDENSNKESKETEAKEGSEETGGETNDPAFSEANDEATDKNKENDDSDKGNDTEATKLQIEKPFPVPIEQSTDGNITLEASGHEEFDKSLLEKYNKTTYEIVNNITERLPFSDNNSKAAVRANDVISAGIFPASRTQQSNGQQMLKSHSFLLWLVVVKMLAFDFNLKNIQFHLMLKPTPMA